MNIKETIEYILQAFKFLFVVKPWESCLRIRFGKYQKVYKPGIYFRLPFFDEVFKQPVRMRVCSMPMQTIEIDSKVSLILKCAIGYEITDIEKLYNTVHQPQTTLINMTMGVITKAAKANKEITIDEIKREVLTRLETTDYGMSFKYFEVLNYCKVRTYRIIKDTFWEDSDILEE